MNIVLLQYRLSEEQIRALLEEFPQYVFLAPTEVQYKKLGDEEWQRIEIFFGSKLQKEDLERASQLRWIHSPIPNVSTLCLNEIEKRGNILVTIAKEENSVQIAEYVLGGVLAFAKNLFHWETVDRNPKIVWDSRWRESMWTLQEKVFLQVGLDNIGTEIARIAKEFKMRVYGMQDLHSFHPVCKKVLTYEDLPDILPHADVICCALPRLQQKKCLFGKKEIALMKPDSIFAVIGGKEVFDEEALVEEIQEKNKFRGILLDAFYQLPIPEKSKLWNLPNILITPEVAPRPRTSEKETFRLLHHNLRQYIHNNFNDMRTLIGTKKTFIV